MVGCAGRINTGGGCVMSDIEIEITKKNGNTEKRIVGNCYLPELVSVIIETMGSFEKIVITKITRGNDESSS
jgi:hypothetical protein